ncbi:MAG TPA: hypothetical protein VKZ89_10575, partial [Thermobifida alba]|nr:hypothetical protein [Thermobifida alba]
TGLDVTAVGGYLGSFDYVSGSGKRSRQFTFAVDVATPEPVALQEHDGHTWTPLTDDPPVTDEVKAVLNTYREAQNR